MDEERREGEERAPPHGRTQTNNCRVKDRKSMGAKIWKSLVRSKTATLFQNINCKKANSYLADTLTKHTKLKSPAGTNPQTDVCLV